MKLLRLLCAAGICSLVFVASAANVPETHPAFPHESSDLAPDPRVTFGRLENGLRYAILAHPLPAGAVSFRLQVDVGSYHEAEYERGYAHFVEHMVFNGTRDFPGQEVFQALRILGANPGSADMNATTTRFKTEYRIENLPTDRPEDLAMALRILRNFADGALFDEKEVAQERSVILAEGRSSGMARLNGSWIDELEFIPPLARSIRVHELEGLFDETRVEHRRPMGSARAIKRATSKSLRAFYDRWYRPERMILTVGGDIEPASLQPLISEAFGSLAARGPAAAAPEIAAPRTPVPPLPRIFGRQDPHGTEESVTLANAVPRSGPDNEQRRRLQLVRQLALEMVATRIRRESPIPLRLAAWIAHDVPGWELTLIRNEGLPEHITNAAILLDTEVRRAVEFGFTPIEVEAAVKRATVEVAQREASATNWTASVLTRALANAISRDVVFTSPADDRVRAEAMLKSVTSDECLAALRSLWPMQTTQVLLFGPQPKNRVENGELRSEMDLARALPLGRPRPPPAPRPFPYTDFGPRGEIVEERHDAALDCWFVRFANGVRLTIKTTQHEREWARVLFGFGDGRLAAPAEHLAYPWSVFTLLSCGTQGLTPSEEHSPLLGLSFKRQVTLDPDAFGMEAQLPARDLERGLQYLAAVLQHADWERESESGFRAWFASLLNQERTARGAAERAFRAAIDSRKPMWSPTIADAKTFPLADAISWLQSTLPDCPIEIAVVGDVDRTAVTEAVALTVGALATRRDPMARDDPRRITSPPQRRDLQVRFAGGKNLAAAYLGWTWLDEPGVADDARLALLAEIVDDRLFTRIREELGLTYSPSASIFSMRDACRPQLVLQCYVEAAPRQLARATTAVRQIAAAIARDGVTAGELERARKPLQRLWHSQRLSNAWWLERFKHAQTDPESLEGLAQRDAILAACTREEVNALARLLLDPARTVEVSASPK